ncbi:uncharacterized protein LOC118761655, partial [Octopus sinensis]|uniref:Uncharacterized protein LOC118761655 n=1 Tax=Octopus sinensis TaxID=2607531 RepID=A0A7E6EK18_9MOLL
MISASKLRDSLAKFHQKLGTPLIMVGVMFVMMAVTYFHQTSRISELEKRDIEQTTRPPTPSGGKFCILMAIIFTPVFICTRIMNCFLLCFSPSLYLFFIFSSQSFVAYSLER